MSASRSSAAKCKAVAAGRDLVSFDGLNRTVVMVVSGPRSNRRQPEHIGALELGVGLLNSFARKSDQRIARIGKLQEPGFDPKWKSINLAGTVPGLARFPAAQKWLDSHAPAAQASR